MAMHRVPVALRRFTPEKRLGLIYFALLSVIPVFLISCGGGKALESGERGLTTAGMHVPDGFVVEQAVPPDMVSYPMFATLDNTGRLFVIESSGKTTSTEDVLENPTFKVLLLEDLEADGTYDKRHVYADKIPYPMGGTFYRGSFYVAAPPDLLRFTDADGDGVAEKREVILTGWTLSHNAATLSGPFFGPDGWLYMCDARRGFDIMTKEGTELKGKTARIWRCRPDGTGLEAMSGGGFDNTIELIFMPSGETIGTMTYFTDPKDGFRDALMHWVEGGVYPKNHPTIEQDSLTMTGDLMPVMTKLPRIAHAGLMRYRGSAFGDAFEGNLFSAQFNTGRVMRHIVTPAGATFKTEEVPFMTCDSLDNHPTDVLEDADGSLLVVNTGGWFIAGCPLSVVAKTDIHGGIFRIRKIDAPAVEDPWGRGLDFRSMAADRVATYLEDPRPAVRDNAIEQLVLAGEEAIEPLQKIATSSENEEVRTAAVFALYRIHLPLAMESVRRSLSDASAMVRTAAARACGLAKDREAVDALMEMVKKDTAPVRRQAATALGQIGDERATAALLEAAANPDDRFVEHAIIYSLITLGKTARVVESLRDASPHVRKAALIALDQKEVSPLRKDQVVPFLNSKNDGLQNTGIWVVSHHPEWSDIVITFLKAQLKKPALSREEQASVANLMITFSRDENLQDFVSSELQNARTPRERKLLLLDVIARAPVKTLPAGWVGILRSLLRNDDASIRSAVLDLIASRSIPALEDELREIVADPKTPPAFQLQALGAWIMSHPELSDEGFQILLGYLAPGHESPMRQSAVRLLVQAQLSDRQLLTLAKDQVAQADLFLLPGLISAFEGNHNEDVGKALITALGTSTDRLDNLSAHDLQQLIDGFPESVQASSRPLIAALEKRQASRLSRLQKLQKELKGGDVRQGRKLFFGKAVCSTCHSVIGQGGDFGPDLTNIGDIRSRHDILEAIVYPSASFAREHETFRITTKANSYTGIIKGQFPEAILVETGPGVSVRVSRAEIASIEPQNISMMPPGLNDQLTTAEMADLLAYLTSLPDGLAEVRRKSSGGH